MFSTLANGESYSKLDLARAYKQMKVSECSQPLLTINTHIGLFCYSMLPFGLTTAPALWQKAMAEVLSGIPGVVYFIDDILVTGSTRTEHEANLCKVLTRIQEHGLFLNKAKCVFFQKELEFLGHHISNEGIRQTNQHVKAIQEAPTLQNKVEMQSFLGMLTYNSKFMPLLSQTVHPLHHLLQKNCQWAWKAKHQETFTAAKQLLCEDSLLVYYDIEKPIKLFCDASAYGVGACLAHVMPNGQERPVAYASRTLTAAERNYTQIE